MAASVAVEELVNEAPPQGVRTRDRILSTAARLFSQKGYEHTPLSHVAREANVSKALILWHFESKEDLFRAALGRTLEPYYIDMGDIGSLDEQKQIETLIDSYFKFVRENGYSVRFIVDLMVRESGPDEVMSHVHELYVVFRNLLAEAIDRGRLSGRFRPDVEPELDAALIVTTLDGILMERFLSEKGRPTTAENLVEHLKKTTLLRILS